MPMDRETQIRLVNLRDETGVLSLYVNADPRQTGSQPPWKKRLEQGLRLLLESVDGRTRSILERRLHELALEIEHLVRPGSPGVGRALFVPLSDGETFSVEMQTPLTDRVALAPRSHIAPMFAAWAEGSPTGIAVVDGHGMRILDSRFGLCEEISGLAFEPRTEEWREFAGPATQKSAWGKREGQSSSSQRDLFDFRLAEHLNRFLAAAHTTLETHVATFGWEMLLVAGEPELVDATSKSLSNSLKNEVVPSQRVLGQATPAQIQQTLKPEMAAARRRRDERLAAEFAEAPPKASFGSTPTVEALQAGRVDRLVLERDSVWSGERIPPGSVLADGVPQSEPEVATALSEAELGEQMIEMGLASDAAVSILCDGVRLPEKAEGVGGFLRW
ncbi:VLRF1 family aeRF1-type release factor [Glycomyces xiaoerkulensis]|uniref:VLRF1 family aeRF1-type release factor n=1 Tax=Glycomyces xiaoerkulensis TaxID=2038139 RepID=UPI000C26176A|nr:VLRF1 family aeRF1-type release factor [Glycomyces xiaoerkulensis]